MQALVGYTGFVGSNILDNFAFDALYNSTNISKAFGTKPSLLVFAGLRAEKYLANTNPTEDFAMVLEAMENIRRIAPKKLVLISTIDVFKNPKNVYEDSTIETNELHPYGLHRFRLEEMVRKEFPDALIIRLPGLFGKNLKKNFIFDMVQIIPSMLREEKLSELAKREPVLLTHYHPLGNGFYKLKDLDKDTTIILQNLFISLGFTALHFTDSRSRFQFYPLERLGDDLKVLLDTDVKLWHPATEPLSASEIYYYIKGENFINELPIKPLDYNFLSQHASIFKGKNGYIMDKTAVLDSLKQFINNANLT